MAASFNALIMCREHMQKQKPYILNKHRAYARGARGSCSPINTLQVILETSEVLGTTNERLVQVILETSLSSQSYAVHDSPQLTIL